MLGHELGFNLSFINLQKNLCHLRCLLPPVSPRVVVFQKVTRGRGVLSHRDGQNPT